MSKIIIQRFDYSRSAGLVKCNIYLDNEKIDLIAVEEQKEIDVRAGSHSLYLKMGLNKTHELSFKIDEDETKRFRVIGKMPRSSYVLMLVVCVGVIVINQLTKKPSYTYGIAFAIIVLLVFYVFFYKKQNNQYLNLEEVK